MTSNSWEYTGDGHALALLAGAPLLNMEFVQFHPTGMVWPPSVKGILVTESVRGDGGVLRNSEGKRFMFDYVPDVFKEKYAQSEEEGDRWYEDPDHNRRPPELLPRDEVARAINSEVKAGRGSPHGGVFLDVSTRMPAEVIRRRLPSMYHQFKELADVDITAEAMEVGPTCHYVMGGIAVDSDTAAARGVPGLFAAGEVAGGMHGSNRLGGNSLSDLLVFGRRAGLHAAEYAAGRRPRPAVDDDPDRRGRGGGAAPLLRRGTRLRRGAHGRPGGEPVHPAPGTPADHERPGRHHPPRGRDGAGAGEAGRAAGTGPARRRRGPPPVQPGLASLPGPAEHAAGQRVRGAGGAGAHRVARRPHPRGPSGDGAQPGAGSTCCAGSPTRAAGRRPPTRRAGQIDLARETTDPVRPDLLALFEKEELVKYLTEEELYE